MENNATKVMAFPQRTFTSLNQGVFHGLLPTGWCNMPHCKRDTHFIETKIFWTTDFKERGCQLASAFP